MKILLINILSRIYNGAFKKRTNEFVYLIILSSIFIKVISLINSDIESLYIFLIVVSGFLCITTIRASNNTIYNIITNHLSMNIKNSFQYHSLDYYESRSEISELFKEEFIDGLINLSYKPLCGKIKLTTHKWVYEKIICDDRVQRLYNIDIKQKGKCRIPQEVLLLNSNSSFIKNQGKLNKTAFQERDQFKIILKKKIK